MPSSCLCNRWVRIQFDLFISLNAWFYLTGRIEIPDRQAIVASCTQASAVSTYVLTSVDPSLRLRAVTRDLSDSDAERGKLERTFDAQELGEIIDDDITCMNVVVVERNVFFRAVPSQD